MSKSHIFFWLKSNVSLNLAFNYISFPTYNKQIFTTFPMKRVIFCELLLWKQSRTKLYLGNFLLFVLIEDVHPLGFQWLYQMANACLGGLVGHRVSGFYLNYQLVSRNYSCKILMQKKTSQCTSKVIQGSFCNISGTWTDSKTS